MKVKKKNDSSENLDWTLKLDLSHLSAAKQIIVKKMLNWQK